jgi:hypothetical protein
MKKSTPNTSLLIFLLFLVSYFTDKQVQAQSDTALFESHYVLPDFAAGSVKMKDGRTEVALMNYNKLTEEMIFDKDGVKLALDSLETIDTVYIESRIFVPHEKIFYELLVKGPISLFMQHKCDLLLAGSPSGYGGTTETGAATSISYLSRSGGIYKLKLPGGYHVTDATHFWIRRKDTFYKANSGSQIMKIFPEKSKEIKQFIKQNNLNLKNINDQITLVLKCHEFVR